MAQYTERFSDYIKNGKNTFREEFDKIPTFRFESFTISLYDLFIQRNSFREIGSETEELFEHYLERTIKEVQIIFSKKIKLYIDNFNLLLDRKVGTYAEDIDEYYLNPATSSSNLKIQDKSTSSSSREQVFGYFKSNPELMSAMLKIEDIYYNALIYFDKLFMGVL